MKLNRKEILDLLRSFEVNQISELKNGFRDYEANFKKRQKREDQRVTWHSMRS
jgi:hypothetical protein